MKPEVNRWVLGAKGELRKKNYLYRKEQFCEETRRWFSGGCEHTLRNSLTGKCLVFISKNENDRKIILQNKIIDVINDTWACFHRESMQDT